MSANYTNSPTKRLRRLVVFRGLMDRAAVDRADRDGLIRLLERADRAPRRKVVLVEPLTREAVC